MLTTKRKPATVGEILTEEFMQPMGLTQARSPRRWASSASTSTNYTAIAGPRTGDVRPMVSRPRRFESRRRSAATKAVFHLAEIIASGIRISRVSSEDRRGRRSGSGRRFFFDA